MLAAPAVAVGQNGTGGLLAAPRAVIKEYAYAEDLVLLAIMWVTDDFVVKLMEDYKIATIFRAYDNLVVRIRF